MSVGRHLVACLHDDDIAYDHFSAWYLDDFSFTHHLHGLFLAQLGKHVKLAGCIALKDESDSCCQENGKDDTYCLYKILLDEGQYQRDDSGNQQDANHRVLILLQIQGPHRLSLGWCQHVLTMLKTALLDLYRC